MVDKLLGMDPVSETDGLSDNVDHKHQKNWF